MKHRFGFTLLLACFAVAGYARVHAAPQPPPRLYFPNITNQYPTPSNGWETLLIDGFESVNADWVFEDRSTGAGGDVRPARRTCNPFSSTHSAWLVGGGADGSQLPCGANYPHRADSWMIAGPFDFSDATTAQFTWQLWFQNDFDPADKFCYLGSTDRIRWVANCLTVPTGGWSPLSLPLADYLGSPQVWLAFRFVSDGVDSTTGGAFVDDVAIRKCIKPACPPLGIPRSEATPSATVRQRISP